MTDREEYRERMEWFVDARFGMFIHWGLYAIPARGEWVRSVERMPLDQYEPFFDEFNPADFDPHAWAAAAKDAGMKYAVLTAKHHDGFCLFDSAHTDYKATNTPCGRDLVREYLEAFRAQGLRVGLYYSLIDWHHPDYPHYGDAIHPMRGDPAYGNEGRDFNRYLDYMHAQVRELCENYGKIDILWFDFSYDHMTGETWRATELVRMVRALQPHVVIDNRLEVNAKAKGSLFGGEPTEYSGDFVSPEQMIPPQGVTDAHGKPLVWEACVTMNNNWGYCEGDRGFKSAPMLIDKLVECVSKGGNLLLNVGPDACGRVPDESLAILVDIGRWMKKNGRSVYGCGPAGLPKPENGRVTKRGDTLYYHIDRSEIGYTVLWGITPAQVRSIRLLSSGAQLPIASGWITQDYPDAVFISLHGRGGAPELPDPVDTVVEVRLV